LLISFLSLYLYKLYDMRIRRKFLQLTNYTYPYGTEGFLKSYLPKGYQKDDWGNFFIVIGENPTSMFTCHLDTACTKQSRVKHVQNGNMIKTDGKTILGADDKAGMVVLLYMIENKIPGLYYFFIGEELGCIGSGDLAKNWEKFELGKNINKCVSFDRRGTKSIITHQFAGRCCSDEFGQDLANKLNETGTGLQMQLDNTGILTDSARFTNLIPECTNISVGYYNEHTTSEIQDIEHLSKLCKSVCLIDWNSITIKRNIDDIDCNFDDEDPDFADEEFSEEFYSYFKIEPGRPSKKMYISIEQIEKEQELILDWVVNRSSYFGVESISWNGHLLHVESSNGSIDFVGYRHDLVTFVPELDEIDMKHLSHTTNNILI